MQLQFRWDNGKKYRTAVSRGRRETGRTKNNDETVRGRWGEIE